MLNATLTRALIAAVQHSTEAMVLSDPHQPDHPLIAANGAFASMTGYALTEIVGRNCRFLQGPGTDLGTAERIKQAIRDEAGCIEWIVNHKKGGRAFWNLLFLSPVHDRAGRLLHYFGNQLDITTGLPERLDAVTFGRARMSMANQAEFEHLLLDILEDEDAVRADPETPARALERIIATSRRLAEISTDLQPGDAPVAVPDLR